MGQRGVERGEHADAHLVGQAADGGAQRGQEVLRAAAGVGDQVQAVADADEGAREEGAQAQRLVVQQRGEVRVGRAVDLEAAVQAEPVDHVGANAAADGVGRLADDDLVAGPHEVHRADQAGDAGAHDDDVRGVRDRGHGRGRYPQAPTSRCSP